MPASKNRKLIKRPSWTKYKIQSCTLLELNARMGWEQTQFTKFTTHVRSTTEALGLDSEVGPDKQPAAKWASLIQKCIEKFPALGTDFQDAWPIEFYFSKYTYSKWINGSRCAKPQEPQQAQRGGKAVPDGSKKRKAYKENDAQSNSSNAALKKSNKQIKTTQTTSADNPRPAQPQGLTSSCSSENTPNNSQRVRDTAIPVPTVTSSASAVERAACATCVLCGFQPPIPRAQKAALFQFFKEHEDLRTCFEAAGIVADHHFRCLLRLSTHRREGFLQSLAPIMMNQFEVVVLCDMLQDHTDGGRIKEAEQKKLASDCDTRARKILRMELPRPPWSMLNYFSTHECDYTLIQKQMDISDEKEYFDLVRIVEEKVPQFLEIKVWEDQDEAKARALLKSICKERPSFRRFDDYWPLMVFIKRFLAARLAGLPGTLYGRRLRHECPHQRVYPAHQVPPAVTALLSDYGMEELGPSFLFLGVRSDERFAGIVGSRNLKTQLLDDTNLKHLHLTAFQRMMMRHILAEV
ncbi:hypothetical protein FB451DRAFT_1559339 [Mycena latifolia]|nr:hypothetical protein FB451DRAFT_1559339 [Mycena latifolia]